MENNEKPQEKTLSRREFLKWIAWITSGGYLATKLRSIFTGESNSKREIRSVSEKWQLSEFSQIPCSQSHTPDAGVSVIEQDGKTFLVTATADSTLLVEDSITSNWKNGEVVVQPSREVSEKGVAGYLGIASVVVLPDGSWLGFAHAEYHNPEDQNDDGTTAGKRFFAQVEMLQSRDNGQTWSDPTLVTAGSNSEVGWQTGRDASGAGQPSAVIVGDAVKVFFTDWNGGRTDEIYSATAPLTNATEPGAWQVDTTTPAIARPTEEDGYAALPSVIHSKVLGKYLLSFETNTGFYICTSEDAENWDQPELLVDITKDSDLHYPSIVEVAGKLQFICAGGVGPGKNHYPLIAELQKK